MSPTLEDRIFPWAFGSTVIAIIIVHIALIWLVFGH